VSTVAILGAGPIGASIAHRLAQRQCVRLVRLIDAAGAVAAGKALDISQSGPVEHFDTAVVAGDNLLDVAGASVIVCADEVSSGEWEGERGLALVSQIARTGTKAPLVFAGPHQTWLMESAAREAKIPVDRLIGTAASALAAAAQALAGLEVGLSSAEVAIVGRPPRFVPAWTAATAGGTLLSERIPPHRLLALSQSLGRLWPPSPFAIASATAAAVEALIHGSRRLVPAMTVLDGTLGARRRAVLLPLALGQGRVLAHQLPTLSPQERTELMNAIVSM
jgi:malate dehydrogenase